MNKWIDGETLRYDNILNQSEFALELSFFIKELQTIDASDGPATGEHNYFRGCPLMVYHEGTLEALEALGDLVEGCKMS